MIKSIKFKFVATIIGILIFSIGIPTFFLLNQFEANMRERSDEVLNTAIDLSITGLMTGMTNNGKKQIPEVIDRVAHSQGIDHVRIFNKEGVILYSSHRAEEKKLISEIIPDAIIANEREVRFKGDGSYIATEPLKNEIVCQKCHDSSKKIIAYIGIDNKVTSAERKFYVGAKHSFYLAIVVLIVMFSSLYIIFDKFINKPIKNFIYAMGKVEQGDLTTKLNDKREDEFGLINTRFNKMVDKLNESKRKIDELHLEQLQQADKLSTLGEMTAEIAHEINNPVAIIFSRADFLQMEFDESETLRKYRDDIDVIMHQVERVSKITSNVLKYSRKSSTDFKKINLVSVINESEAIEKPLLEKKGIFLTTYFDNEEILITGNELQIEQLIINLVNNAADAIESNGNISIKIIEDENIKLIISDDGSGIDEEKIADIFSPFFTTKPTGKGTGLGLYICKNICKNHNAEISCQSVENEGTTFTITFRKEES